MLVGVLAVIGLAAVALAVLFKHKAPRAVQETASDSPHAVVTENAAPSAPETEPQASVQPAVTPAPTEGAPALPAVAAQAPAAGPLLQDLIKTLMDPSQSLKARKEAIA